MNEFITPIAITGTLLAVLMGYVLIRTPMRDPLKYLLVAALVGGSAFAADVVADRLGYAVPATLPKQAVLLKHHIVMEDNQKARIELWMNDQNRSRLYRIPYSKQAEEAIEKGIQAARKGGKLVLRRGERKEGALPDDPPEFHTDILTPQMEFPKGIAPDEEDAMPPPPSPWDKGA